LVPYPPKSEENPEIPRPQRSVNIVSGSYGRSSGIDARNQGMSDLIWSCSIPRDEWYQRDWVYIRLDKNDRLKLRHRL